MRKNGLLNSVAILSLVVWGNAANAADVVRPVTVVRPPVANWTGCYVGVNTGWGWGNGTANGHESDGDPTDFLSNDIHLSGGVFGGQIGCDWQHSPDWVFGVRGMIAGTDINGFGNDRYPGTDASAPDLAKIDGLGSITGRVGWTGGNQSRLWYLQAGWAFAHDRLSFSPCDPYYYLDTCTINASESRNGWTIGIGGEQMLNFAPGASVFAEANWYDFGHDNISLFDGEDFTNVHQTVGTVLVGLNFRWGH
jgi:outer membrane immunogenic protein